MTQRAHCLLSLALALSACVDVAAGPIGTNGLEITGGGMETGYLAVFAIAYDGQGGCTGTCITPHVGLTAAHCIEGAAVSSMTALFGDSEENPETSVQVTAAAAAADGGDIAVLAFSEACPEIIPHNRIPLESHIDEPVVMVGFGVTAEEAEDAGVKRSGTATLFSVDPAQVNGLEAGELATSNDPAGTCYGDSGGPTFMTFGGIEYAVGVTSRGSLDDRGQDEPCGQGRSIAVRADSYSAFVDQFIADNEPSDGSDEEDEIPDGSNPGDGDGDDDPDGTSPDEDNEPEGKGTVGGEGEGLNAATCQAGCHFVPHGAGDWSPIVDLAWLAACAGLIRSRRRQSTR